MCDRHRVVDVRQQLGKLIGEVVWSGGSPIALQRESGQRIAAGRAADGEIDAVAVQALSMLKVSATLSGL